MLFHRCQNIREKKTRCKYDVHVKTLLCSSAMLIRATRHKQDKCDLHQLPLTTSVKVNSQDAMALGKNKTEK